MGSQSQGSSPSVGVAGLEPCESRVSLCGGREERAAIRTAGATELIHSLADCALQGREEMGIGQEVQGLVGLPERTVAWQVKGCWTPQQGPELLVELSLEEGQLWLSRSQL